MVKKIIRYIRYNNFRMSAKPEKKKLELEKTLLSTADSQILREIADHDSKNYSDTLNEELQNLRMVAAGHSNAEGYGGGFEYDVSGIKNDTGSFIPPDDNKLPGEDWTLGQGIPLFEEEERMDQDISDYLLRDSKATWLSTTEQ